MVLFSACAKNTEAVSQSAFNNLKLDFWGKEWVILGYYTVGLGPVIPNYHKLLSLVFYEEFVAPQMKSSLELAWDRSFLTALKILTCMRNLAVCGGLFMASSASDAVTCLVCRMVGVGRGVWKIFVFQKDCILPA